jgi:hypothetical protein
VLPTNQQKEDLSRAYVRAIAGRAGVLCAEPRQDYGLDLFLRGVVSGEHRHLDSGFQIDLQLKSTTRAEVRETQVAYDLEIRAYEMLRRATPIPSLLVLLVLPEDEIAWLTQTEEQLSLRTCAYWLSLRDAPSTTNEATIRVLLPRLNVFSVKAVQLLMDRLRKGDPL